MVTLSMCKINHIPGELGEEASLCGTGLGLEEVPAQIFLTKGIKAHYFRED